MLETDMLHATPPNHVIDAGGFYVSYNACDAGIYGSDTTALVLGQMEKFFILNGDHRAVYRGLMNDGLDACMGYFRANVAKVNRYSDKLPPAVG
jgi:hypothetical protein